jgi:hypothetical protein
MKLLAVAGDFAFDGVHAISGDYVVADVSGCWCHCHIHAIAGDNAVVGISGPVSNVTGVI